MNNNNKNLSKKKQIELISGNLNGVLLNTSREHPTHIDVAKISSPFVLGKLCQNYINFCLPIFYYI